MDKLCCMPWKMTKLLIHSLSLDSKLIQLFVAEYRQSKKQMLLHWLKVRESLFV
jgi:hypothetical protein